MTRNVVVKTKNEILLLNHSIFNMCIIYIKKSVLVKVNSKFLQCNRICSEFLCHCNLLHLFVDQAPDQRLLKFMVFFTVFTSIFLALVLHTSTSTWAVSALFSLCFILEVVILHLIKVTCCNTRRIWITKVGGGGSLPKAEVKKYGAPGHCGD